MLCLFRAPRLVAGSRNWCWRSRRSARFSGETGCIAEKIPPALPIGGVNVASELGAIHHYTTTARFAPADDFAFLLDRGRAANRADDRPIVGFLGQIPLGRRRWMANRLRFRTFFH